MIKEYIIAFNLSCSYVTYGCNGNIKYQNDQLHTENTNLPLQMCNE